MINIPWYEYPELEPDPKSFVLKVEAKAKSRAQAVVLICRSDLRTVEAGIALKQAGFTNVVNMLDGFEGLPWTQT